MLEEEELDDEFFMMRVRTDGALLPAAASGRWARSPRTTPVTPPT